MTKKLFASLVCAFGFLLLGAHPASAGSVSAYLYAEANDGLGNDCIDQGYTSSVGCGVGYADANADAGAWYIGLSADSNSDTYGVFSYGLASGNINDLLTFSDGSSTGPAFVVFDFDVQNFDFCSYSYLDATAGNQAVPLSSSYGESAMFTFTTTPQAVTFGSPFAFGMSADLGCTFGELQLNLDLEDVLVLNANGNPIPGISLTSGSGENYPLDSRNITPEPASLSLLATGTLGIFAVVRRKIA